VPWRGRVTAADGCSEDILALNGIKLLARGARIDANVREHKLHKPLEECVEAVDGVIPARFGLAEQLIQQRPLLGSVLRERTSTAGVGHPVDPVDVDAMQSLLTVYAAHKEDRLQHTSESRCSRSRWGPLARDCAQASGPAASHHPRAGQFARGILIAHLGSKP
jgi:hypothetical protein